MFSGGSFDGGKRESESQHVLIHSIYPVVLAPRHAIIAAMQWPRLIIFRLSVGRNEEEGKKGRENGGVEGTNRHRFRREVCLMSNSEVL